MIRIPIDPPARIQEEAERLAADWEADERWQGIRRPYSAEEVVGCAARSASSTRSRGSGAERLWRLLTTEDYVAALGALTGGQAVQMVKAGLKAIYLSGWQVAADANLSGQTYPDQSLYPSNTRARARPPPEQRAPARRPDRVGRGRRLDRLARADRRRRRGRLRRPAARVRADEVDDRGRRGGRPLRGPARRRRRSAATSAARCSCRRRSSCARSSARGSPSDVLGVPTVLVARTDALSATLLTSDADPADAEFLTGERTPRASTACATGSSPAIARSLAYAPYADVIWFETSTPDLEEARAVRRRDPRALPAQAARVQLLAVVQLAEAPVGRGDRDVPAASSARWATASSSSRSPASTR